ncbi:MAG: N-acetyl-gamma-glutamyl-phosphate reductase, partial [Pelagibacteraceae bacterium]
EAISSKYKNEAFVKVFNSIAINTDKIVNTNKAHIAIFKNKMKGSFIVSCTIDNLLKGAAGQAVQNFNIRFGFDEKLGLE